MVKKFTAEDAELRKVKTRTDANPHSYSPVTYFLIIVPISLRNSASSAVKAFKHYALLLIRLPCTLIR